MKNGFQVSWNFEFKKERKRGTFFNKETTKDIPRVSLPQKQKRYWLGSCVFALDEEKVRRVTHTGLCETAPSVHI